jgi:hypothetical protein
VTSAAQAISHYLHAVEVGLRSFEEKYGRRDVLRAWHQGDIPQTGRLPGGVEYELHGVGCRLYFPTFEVDFDFGPHGRSDGFDAWRLNQYTKQFPDQFPELQDLRAVEDALEDLEGDGEIEKPFPNVELYFLRSKNEQNSNI